MSTTTLPSAEALVTEMRQRVDDYCRTLDDRLPAYSYVTLERDEQRLLVLQSRLYNEIRAADVYGGWLRSTPEFEMKRLCAHNAHEELGHAQLLMRQIEARGVDPLAYTPPPSQVALFNTLEGLGATVERLAAFPLAGEVLATYLIKKAVVAPSVPEWIKEPYRQIGEEEEGHGDYPTELLVRYAVTPETQALVRRGVELGIWLRDQYFRELDEMVFQGRQW